MRTKTVAAGSPHAARGERGTTPPVALTAPRRAVLAAAAARILPSEDGPGAAETGVAFYIESALQDRTHRHLVELFDRGLDFLEALAQERGEAGFAACPPALQDEILRQVQRFPNNEARLYFVSLVQLCIEGFLCDPRHGGNRDQQGWAYIGFSGSACLGREGA